MHSHADVERYYATRVLGVKTIYIGDRDGVVVGYLVVEDEKIVSALFVEASERRKGVGKRLLDFAKAQSSNELELWTFVENSEARKFYARERFEEIRSTAGENEESLPDVLLQWRRP
ncbi:MAG: GNAT family N-acetyltransferase [Beijerinckiaceae bacterium]